jgi:two-component system OmpR family response regulator
MKFLLVEDEKAMAELISEQLEGVGYVVDRVASLDEAAAAVEVGRYALFILDRRLPDGDSIGFIPELRRTHPGTPILMLTALDAIIDRVKGLNAGADDYLTKPFDTDELVARVRALLRRPGADEQPPIRLGGVSFDTVRREFRVNEEPLILKRRELSILESLMLRARRVVLRSLLMEEAFGFDDDVQSNTLDAHVSRLRRVLSTAGAGVMIHPIRGVGYMLDEVR